MEGGGARLWCDVMGFVPSYFVCIYVCYVSMLHDRQTDRQKERTKEGKKEIPALLGVIQRHLPGGGGGAAGGARDGGGLDSLSK